MPIDSVVKTLEVKKITWHDVIFPYIGIGINNGRRIILFSSKNGDNLIGTVIYDNTFEYKVGYYSTSWLTCGYEPAPLGFEISLKQA